jgi:acyl dehydratase
MAETDDQLRRRLLPWMGRPMSGDDPTDAPDEVNLPMIRHWVDAMDDRDPVYLDEAAAVAAGFGEIVAPPAMLQAWTMGRPQIAGLAERGGAPGKIDPESPLAVLADQGFTGTLATNSDLEFHRYLHLGDRLQSQAAFESISERKTTRLGEGYFLTWATRYTDDAGAEVGRQLFRVFKFAPAKSAPDTSSPETGGRSESQAPKPAAAAAAVPEQSGEVLPPLDLPVTPAVVVAGAIASRDFMPVHHDRDFARAQGAPDIFMNILTTTGYVSRFVTDWAGPTAVLRKISIRLGGPAVPGSTLHFTGHVANESSVDGRRQVEVALSAVNDLGTHVAGSVQLVI